MFLCLQIRSVASFDSIPLAILNINDLGTRKRCERYQKLHCLEINPWYEEVLLKNNVSVTIIKSWNNYQNWHKNCQNINLLFGLLISMKVIRFHCMRNASNFSCSLEKSHLKHAKRKWEGLQLLWTLVKMSQGSIDRFVPHTNFLLGFMWRSWQQRWWISTSQETGGPMDGANGLIRHIWPH